MNLWTLLIVVLIIAVIAGGRFGRGPGVGFYPASYSYGGAGLLVIILIVLLVAGFRN